MNLPLIEYTPKNLRLVIKTIQQLIHKTPLRKDLLVGKWKPINDKYKYAGHCYYASSVLYRIFSSKHLTLMRGDDIAKYSYLKKDDFHWWCKDKVTGEIIDITQEQFSKTHANRIYKTGTRKGYLGFDYRKKHFILLDAVMNKLPEKIILYKDPQTKK